MLEFLGRGGQVRAGVVINGTDHAGVGFGCVELPARSRRIRSFIEGSKPPLGPRRVVTRRKAGDGIHPFNKIDVLQLPRALPIPRKASRSTFAMRRCRNFLHTGNCPRSMARRIDTVLTPMRLAASLTEKASLEPATSRWECFNERHRFLGCKSQSKPATGVFRHVNRKVAGRHFSIGGDSRETFVSGILRPLDGTYAPSFVGVNRLFLTSQKFFSQALKPECRRQWPVS